MSMHLSTIIVTKAEGAFTVEAVGPETTKVDISLAQLGVSDDQPGTEDRLSKHVKDSIGDDLAVDTNTASTVSKTPDTTSH